MVVLVIQSCWINDCFDMSVFDVSVFAVIYIVVDELGYVVTYTLWCELCSQWEWLRGVEVAGPCGRS